MALARRDGRSTPTPGRALDIRPIISRLLYPCWAAWSVNSPAKANPSLQPQFVVDLKVNLKLSPPFLFPAPLISKPPDKPVWLAPAGRISERQENNSLHLYTHRRLLGTEEGEGQDNEGGQGHSTALHYAPLISARYTQSAGPSPCSVSTLAATWPFQSRHPLDAWHSPMPPAAANLASSCSKPVWTATR